MVRRRWRNAADGELLDACRAGRTEAFSVLWERHRRAALTAARGIAPGLDAEDLVSDAYLKIYQLVVDGRGPRGAFRPYLYQTIRTAAADQLRTRALTIVDLGQIPEPVDAGPDEEAAFDLDAVKQAFAALDERRQAALWYAEVEGLPPRKAAAFLGLSANATAVLTKRAREALRSAWIEAHANPERAEAECREVLSRLQRFQRGRLPAGTRRGIESHLAGCPSCSAVAADFSELNRRLGLILAGALLGGVGLGPLLAQLGVGVSAASAAALAGGSGSAAAAGVAGTAGAGGAASLGGTAAASLAGTTAAASVSVGGVGAAIAGTLSTATVAVGAVALTASAVIAPNPQPTAAETPSSITAAYATPAEQSNRGGSETSHAHRRDRLNRGTEKQRGPKADRQRQQAKPGNPQPGPKPQKSKTKQPEQKPPQKTRQPQKTQPNGPAEKPKKAKPTPPPMAAERGGRPATRG